MRLSTLSPILLTIALFGACCRSARAQEIVEATKRGDKAAVERILQQNPQAVLDADDDGARAISWAAALNQVDIIQLLFDHGSAINYHQKNGWTPLISAADSGRIEATELLVKRGADMGARAADGNQAIHFAARNGYPDLVALLLTLGADVDAPNGDGNTPMAVAAWYDRRNVGIYLIAAGANISIKNNAGNTARDEALRNGKTEFANILDHYQGLLNERATRDTLRREAGLKIRTSYASWTDLNARTRVVYHNDFADRRVGPEWSTYVMPGTEQAPLRVSTTPVGARPFLGDFGSQAARLTLNDLPEHSEVAVIFDLFLIRTWDGNLLTSGPDVWSLSVNEGPTLLRTTFMLYGPNAKTQAYPGEYPGDHYVPRAEAFENNTLGYTFPVNGKPTPFDAVYRIRYTFPHHGKILPLDFAAIGLQELSDESWGITNIEVSIPVAPTPVAKKPEPKPTPHATPPKKVAATTKKTTKSVGKKSTTTKTASGKSTSAKSPDRLHDKKEPPKP
ncbi:MAG TPA: ankyrin repeat domain-containing protein [Chthonomonadaceae bacterium]|nr:ankyrin repeat domain-containing protein [Chthonomonadaceae bacterium]